MVCVLSTWFGDICGLRSLYFKYYSLRLLTPRPMQYLVPENLVSRNALAIGRRHSATRRRIVPCDLRCASLPVAAAIFYNVSRYFVFKEVVRYAARRVWYSFASELHGFPHWQTFGWLQLIGMRVVRYKL